MSESIFKPKSTEFSDNAIQLSERSHPPVSADESIRSGLRDLAELARRAFEENRRKDCIAVTCAILKIDPDNQDARILQECIRSDLRRDVEQACALMWDARFQNDRAPFERARMMFQSVLDIDPADEDAKFLLARAESVLRNAPQCPSAPVAKPLPERSQPTLEEGPDGLERPHTRWFGSALLIGCILMVGVAIAFLYRGLQEWRDLSGMHSAFAAAPGNLQITVDGSVQVYVNDEYAGTAPIPDLELEPGVYQLRYEFDGVEVGQEEVTVASGEITGNAMRALLGRLELMVIPSSGAQMRIDGRLAMPVPRYVDVKAGRHRLAFSAKGYESQTVSVSVTAGGRSNVRVILSPDLPDAFGPPSFAIESGSSGSVNGPTGFLAVSSPLPVEIYMDSKRVGYTPVTLELAAGSHTLEYHYNDLHKTGVHFIESNQTTRTTIIFEVTVRIRSTPSAEVLLGGIQPRSVGQTPLNDIRLPIGSMLIFQSPGFPEKRHTITEKDAVIDVEFP